MMCVVAWILSRIEWPVWVGPARSSRRVRVSASPTPFHGPLRTDPDPGNLEFGYWEINAVCGPMPDVANGCPGGMPWDSTSPRMRSAVVIGN